VKKRGFYTNRLTGGGASPSEDRFKKVLKLCEKQRAGNILDIGCGDGALTVLLKEALGADKAYGIELSNEGMSLAQKQGIECHSLDIDGTTLPFEDEFFDFVFCGEVIEHLFNPDLLLEEIYRILKKGGRCVITIPNLACWRSRIALLFGYQPYALSASLEQAELGKFLHKSSQGIKEHIRLMTLRAFKELLIYHKFKIKHIQGSYTDVAPFFTNPLWRLLALFEKTLSRCPSLAIDIVAEVEKEDKG